jgi:hypothetical protein
MLGNQDQTVSRGGLAWIEHPLIAHYSWLVHAFSTRRGAVSHVISEGLNLGFTPGEPREQVQENRELFSQKLGAEHFALASLRQVHSATVYEVLHADAGGLAYRFCGNSMPEPSGATQPPGDALISNEAGILLSVRTADCLPVLLVDPQKRAVAAVHAGWRGALARLVETAVGEMRRVYGSQSRSLLAVMGPCIRACCYEIGPEVVEAFHASFPCAGTFFRKVAGASELHPLTALNPGGTPRRTPTATTFHLDLIAVARHQLITAGLAPANLAGVDFCTGCRTDMFYSYRKEGSNTGRMMAVIGIRADGRPPGSTKVRSPLLT